VSEAVVTYFSPHLGGSYSTIDKTGYTDGRMWYVISIDGETRDRKQQQQQQHTHTHTHTHLLLSILLLMFAAFILGKSHSCIHLQSICMLETVT
jgi:uncharacterized ion transporter superfamily protein YfcC